MTSYKDPKWRELEESAEAKYGIPPGFLADLRLKGERSNADQVSEAGAKSVWQVIPETRSLIKKKYGVDAYAGPEQAAEAAAIVVKDAFNWAKQRTKNPEEQKSLAAGYYHAGGDTANWGKKTDAYMKRVTGSAPDAQIAQGRSLSGELSAKKEQGSIATVYDAYKSGRMTPEDSAAFESAVNSGAIMLPHGAAVKSAEPSVMAVVRAYSSGQMSPEDAQAFREAVNSGSIKLPPNIALAAPGSGASQIPIDNPQSLTQQQPEPSFMDKVVGAGEAALAMGTGMVGGSLGMAAGAVRGAGELIVNGGYGAPEGADVVQRNAMGAAQAMTYQPRTPTGQQYTQAVGKAVGDIAPPVLPMMAASSGAITQGIKASAPMAAVAARRAAAPVVTAAQNVAQRAQAVMPGGPGPASIGAAQVEAGLLRQSKANELPIPIKQTLGQRTRDYGQQQFERETVKDVDVGAPIRDRMQQQQAQMRQNLDAFVDATGAEATDLRGAGIKVNDALRSMVAQAKAKERVLYKEAEKAGELSAPVNLSPLADYLNSNRAGRQSAPIIGTIADSLGVQEIGKGSLADGSIVAGTATLRQAEEIRKTVNRFVKSNDPNDVRIGSEIKGVIDTITEGAGGDIYKQARTARMQRAKDFENVALVSNLLGTKRGSTDRAIALEDVVRKAIIEPSTSLDQVKHLGGVILKKTPQGQQAWKELQGATLGYIRDEAYKGVTRDAAGNQVISPANLNRAITNLDKTGKLDYLYGKKGAEQLRTLNEVAQDVFTAPPGSVNTSNTASALMMSLDTLSTFATTGLPVPAIRVLTEARKAMKNREVRKKVDEAIK